MLRSQLFILFLIFSPLTCLTKSHRRVFFGQIITTPSIPYTSIVSIWRTDDNLHHCTGTIINSNQVITAAHCVKDSGKLFYVKYGALNVDRQISTSVVKIDYFGNVDLAILSTAQPFGSPDSSFTYFDKSKWYTMDDLMSLERNKTFMCGFGNYEGDYPNNREPLGVPSKDLRCLSYQFTTNYLTVKANSEEPNSEWPQPGRVTKDFYPIDKRYVLSMSRYPAERDKGGNFPTGCVGDSGSPVFIQLEPEKLQLLAVFIGGGNPCGSLIYGFDYDYAALAKHAQ